MVTLEDFCYQPMHGNSPPRRLNFSYTQPGVIAIIGGNGSGKSTMAQLLAGWYPDFLPGTISGTGNLLGNPIGQLSLTEQAQTIQLVQQSPYLQLSGCTFSVEEEVAFGPENLCLNEQEILARIDMALAFTDCQPLRHRHPSTLSGGEAQRVVIACALAMKPKILLLDETFSRLTEQTTHRLLERLSSWANAEGALVILFAHKPEPMLSYCQHAWQLRAGELVSLC
ncbi:ABC transporter ATP-binding protein [Buttiauxella sp. B2]|uniref:ABC transporter ATP-binding protein n=1 Tax=Buttiauxella sp. B2 TaxID=2587812 RepID=UPI00111E5AD2|nr:ABC transporter ATP-binding protein [Buttiauxella sp. B2]TNV20932.1 ABC transporter ATP-binding protein [Buttiauxella sp. B2]